MKKHFVVAMLLLALQACGVVHNQSKDANAEQDRSEAIDLITLIKKQPKNPITDHLPINPNGPAIERQYIKDCFQEQWYFCPPLDAVYQFKMIVDICKDPHEIIEKGVCIEKFECDPTNANVEIIECLVDSAKGEQKKWCSKGVWKYTDCVPCTEEFCNGIDDDCDSVIDNDIPIQPCYNDCGLGDLICVEGELVCFGPEPDEEICDYIDNDCDGEIDEGQLNICGMCGLVPSEECNSFDDDCDGPVDEDLFRPCATACGEGYEICMSGDWISCTAPPVYPEICDGIDNDCDGNIDEELDCTCTIQDVGVLFPCTENPLICGKGFKTCECVDPDCLEIKTTPCYALCHWFPVPGEVCDPYVGIALSAETCNNFDDDCDVLIDEDLYEACYTGPEATLFVGLCVPGQVMCQEGTWGNINDETNNFVPGYCKDETTPQPEICNAKDDDCDGVTDWGEELDDTDILFVIDWSGSMQVEISAVLTALNQFAANFSDEEVLQWGVVLGPKRIGSFETLILHHNLSGFTNFLSSMSLINFTGMTGSLEMLLDALYLSLQNISGNLSLPIFGLSWNWTDSIPEIPDFLIDWRPNADKFIIVFTDEKEQSYLSPSLGLSDVIGAAVASPKVRIYTFSTHTGWGWDELSDATGGKFYELTDNPTQMYNSLMEILEGICK